MDRIRAGNGPKSVQERGVQKTFVCWMALISVLWNGNVINLLLVVLFRDLYAIPGIL